MARMFFGALEKYDDIVDVNRGMVQLNWSQENVHHFLKCWRGVLQPRRNARLPVKTFVCDEWHFLYSVFVKLDLSIAVADIQYQEYVVQPETVDIFVYSRYGVTIPYCGRI